MRGATSMRAVAYWLEPPAESVTRRARSGRAMTRTAPEGLRRAWPPRPERARRIGPCGRARRRGSPVKSVRAPRGRSAASAAETRRPVALRSRSRRRFPRPGPRGAGRAPRAARRGHLAAGGGGEGGREGGHGGRGLPPGLDQGRAVGEHGERERALLDGLARRDAEPAADGAARRRDRERRHGAERITPSLPPTPRRRRILARPEEAPMAAATVPVVTETRLAGLRLLHRGKVRDVYDLGEHLLIVATDRVSAYDSVLSPGIPDKGRVLTSLSTFWFDVLRDVVPNHVVTTDLAKMPPEVRRHADVLEGRTTLAKRLTMFPVECVVRGYLTGSGWKDYKRTGEVAGHRLPAGLRECARLEPALYTPSTKATVGHDETIDFAATERMVGAEVAARLRDLTLAVYEKASS